MTADANRDLHGCTHDPDETIDGQPAAKYTVRTSGSSTTEAIWIAIKTGLILKSETVSGASKISNRYEYTNVQPPANVR